MSDLPVRAVVMFFLVVIGAFVTGIAVGSWVIPSGVAVLSGEGFAAMRFESLIFANVNDGCFGETGDGWVLAANAGSLLVAFAVGTRCAVAADRWWRIAGVKRGWMTEAQLREYLNSRQVL